jgi:hypothetical protein
LMMRVDAMGFFLWMLRYINCRVCKAME